MFEGNLVNSLRVGSGKMYLEDGQLAFDGVYRNNKEEGRSIFIRDLVYGHLMFEGSIINGQKDGWCKDYNEGQIKSEGFYKNGARDGKYIVYNKLDYTLTEEVSHWSNGTRQGFYKLYNIESSVLNSMNPLSPNYLTNNIMFSDDLEWIEDILSSHINEQGFYDKSLDRNRFIKYHLNGKVKGRYILNNKDNTVDIQEFHDNGQPKFTAKGVLLTTDF